MFERLFKKLFSTPRRAVALRGRYVGRAKTMDDAFKFRMGAGFPGDVNRVHPFSVEPVLIDVNAPPTAYGQPVVVDATTQGVRPLVAGDSGLDAIYGVTVRPFPLQAPSSPNNFGGTQTAGGAITSSGTPPASGVLDVLRAGYIMVKANVGSAPVKGGRVFIWVAATAGNHIQGQFESAASGGNTIELDEKSYFNGVPDANGNVEISFNI